MGHIPDGSMIATVFCNFTGIILTTVVVNLQIHIIPEKDDNYYNIIEFLRSYNILSKIRQ